MIGRPRTVAGPIVIGVLAAVATAGGWISPHDPAAQHPDFVYAPPMRPRLVDQGRLRTPFVYPIRIVDRLERKYEEDRDNPIPLSTLLTAPTSSRPS
jgi:hypothetical protein